MTQFDDDFSRRDLLKGGSALAGASALTMLPWQSAFAATYPDQNLQVYVPTRAGGGADRNLRAFTGVWKNYLKTNFEVVLLSKDKTRYVFQFPNHDETVLN